MYLFLYLFALGALYMAGNNLIKDKDYLGFALWVQAAIALYVVGFMYHGVIPVDPDPTDCYPAVIDGVAVEICSFEEGSEVPDIDEVS